MIKNTLVLLAVATALVTMGAGCGTSVPGYETAATPPPKPWATKACITGSVGFFPNLNNPPKLSGQFQGTAISDIAKNYLALSGSQATALTAATSTDGLYLVVDYVSCDGATGQDVKGFTLDGTVSHLVAFTRPDAAAGRMLAHLPAFGGANFGAMFVPVGFIAATSRVLVQGLVTDMGAGGSCATTYWMSVDFKTAAATSFSTGPDAIVYPYGRSIVYVTPNPCMDPPQSIRVKDTTTGSDKLVKKISGNTFVSLVRIETQEPGGTETRFVLHYTTRDVSSSTSTPATLILP